MLIFNKQLKVAFCNLGKLKSLRTIDKGGFISIDCFFSPKIAKRLKKLYIITLGNKPRILHHDFDSI